MSFEFDTTPTVETSPAEPERKAEPVEKPLRRAVLAERERLVGEVSSIGERERRAVRETLDKVKAAEVRAVPREYRDPQVERREHERQCKLYALRVDDFLRWAYSVGRGDAFDANFFASTDPSLKLKKDVPRIVLEAVNAGFVEFVDAPRRELPDDHVEEALRRVFVRKGSDDVCRLRFTPAGMKHASELWWRDRTKWLDPLRRVSKRAWITLVVVWAIITGIVGLFGGVKEFWKFAEHPIRYFQDE